ncbi:hypothetical protein AB4120_20615 [Cupriavidus sp. 2KB_3]|uniref:hypothetical protein n=1 Tax=Cupriavidus TaxID=106589 RepID=UPI001656827A|nr:hypothetical protein [Cupriavidus campinensis]
MADAIVNVVNAPFGKRLFRVHFLPRFPPSHLHRDIASCPDAVLSCHRLINGAT